jgi:hypothetical protein
MKKPSIIFTIFLLIYLIIFSSCAVIEKSSKHGFESGYYDFKSEKMTAQKVYVNVDDMNVEIYNENKKSQENTPLHFSLSEADTLTFPMEFTKKSLDIDLTTILLKYRPSVKDQPAQMNTDFNLALYAGWRHDRYIVRKEVDPAKNVKKNITGRGYDFGVFAGTGTSLVNPFSTKNRYEDEYNGMILQYGIAGFLESDLASFGLAIGFDHLMSPEKKIWIYNGKPWFGLIIGIALN